MDISIDIIKDNAHYTVTTTDWEIAERFLKQFEPVKETPINEKKTCDNCKYAIPHCPFINECIDYNMWEPREDMKDE